MRRKCIVEWHQDLGRKSRDRIFAPIQDLGDRAVKLCGACF
ncbi:MAG: hypothetical protein ACM65K_11965 [Microcoleus sp.]